MEQRDVGYQDVGLKTLRALGWVILLGVAGVGTVSLVTVAVVLNRVIHNIPL